MKYIVIFLLVVCTFHSIAQIDDYEIALEPIHIDGLPGIQSYAFGQHDGKWLIIGGRSDGLHERFPFSSFDTEGRNTHAIVIDPGAKQFWTTPLDPLSGELKHQLSSTNPAFYQEGNTLYIVGGYGYNPDKEDHQTYRKLIAINVSGLTEAIIQERNIEPFFSEIMEGSQFAVAGGRLNKIDSTYYLVGGHDFNGRYNPENQPTFTQEYTNAVRRFNIYNESDKMFVGYLPSYIDTAHFHRRDFNVVPQIMPNGEEGLTAFSGVFQHQYDLPFLYSVDIYKNTYIVNSDFSQYYNHYHCPAIPIYDAVNNTMHTFFFGGHRAVL